MNVPHAMLGPVAQESVVDSALLRSIFRPFKPAFLYTTCTQNRRNERATLLLGCPLSGQEHFVSLRQNKGQRLYCCAKQLGRLLEHIRVLVLETVHQKAVAVALDECNAIKSQGFGHSELTSGCFLRSTSMVSRA